MEHLFGMSDLDRLKYAILERYVGNRLARYSEAHPNQGTTEADSRADVGTAGVARPSERLRRFAINGKFTSQRMTGVQRTGYELAAAFQRLLSGQTQVPVIVPEAARAEATLPHQRVACRWLKGALWEQIALPFAARGRMLLSLCNMGPLLTRRQIVMIHDVAVYDLPQNYSWKFRLWYRLAFFVLKLNARHILTVSAFSKRRIAACLRIDESRISIVTNAVDHFDRIECDTAILSRLKLEKDCYVLVVGNLSVGKNLSRMLAVIDRIDETHGFKFVIVGGCDLRVFNPKSQADRSASRNIVMAGFVSDAELKAMYENAACFVFPSLYEGFGLPPLEAMHCGCPVIVSREGALPEVCGNAAMYCDAYSVEDIASKLVQMMSDAALRTAYRALGREHARGYRWEFSARALLDVLDREAVALVPDD